MAETKTKLTAETCADARDYNKADAREACEERRRYLIVSGEGEYGTREITEPLTEAELADLVDEERCYGDRWCNVYAGEPYQTISGEWCHDCLQASTWRPIHCGDDCPCGREEED